MIRERRNKEKLASYYKKFMDEGIVDPNASMGSRKLVALPGA